MRKKITLLEDDDGIRTLLEMLFESENYQVYAYASVAALFQGQASHKSDIFLLDVMLPDGNGMDVCKKLKSIKDTAQIPVIMMSAHVYQMEETCSADDFIPKPFDIFNLVGKVRHHLRSDKY